MHDRLHHKGMCSALMTSLNFQNN